MNPVQTNGDTFRQNVILLIKKLEEPLSQDQERTIVAGMEPHFYNVEKMSGQKENLDKRQKLTGKSEKRGEFEKNEPRISAKSYCGEAVKRKGKADKKNYSKWCRIQKKMTARHRDLFVASNRLD